ncbi:zf-HC2 domain-containing protein [bacterium]|nr:zf-HC2 domain-containing protein [bacterium]
MSEKMKSCPMADNGRLIDYVERELDAADLSAIETHLAGCAACRAQVDAIAKTLRYAASPLADPGPTYFASLNVRVRARIEAGEGASPASFMRGLVRRLLAKPVMAAAPLAAALAIALVFAGRSPMTVDLDEMTDVDDEEVRRVAVSFDPSRQLQFDADHGAARVLAEADGPSTGELAAAIALDDDESELDALEDAAAAYSRPASFAVPRFSSLSDAEADAFGERLMLATASYNY